MQKFDGKENWKKQCNPQPRRATLSTFEVLEETNINILQTISKYNHEKCFENKKNDHQRENALLFYQIRSANSLNLIVGWFSNRTGTSADDGARKSNSWLDQWQSDKLGTGSRVESFSRAFQSPNDVPVLLLNHQPSMWTWCLKGRYDRQSLLPLQPFNCSLAPTKYQS